MPARADSTKGRRLGASARLFVALVTLYALALTGLLTRTSAAFDATHMGVICQQLAADSDGSEPLPSEPHHHADSCCVAASVPALADPPAVAAIAVAWPSRPTLVSAWTEASAAPRPTPPRRTARPRAPPSFEPIG